MLSRQVEDVFDVLIYFLRFISYNDRKTIHSSRLQQFIKLIRFCTALSQISEGHH